MKVGRLGVSVPWWRVLAMKITGQWWAFLVHVEQIDHDPCPVCRASVGEHCDAGLHS